MSLADDIQREATVNSRRRSCGVHTLLNKLDDDDRAVLEVYLHEDNIDSAAIQRALAKNGHEIGLATLQRHRRDACACSKVAGS